MDAGLLGTVETRDGKTLPLLDGPFRCVIEDERLMGVAGGEWKECLADELRKSSAETSGTDTVMNVSTSRESTTVSSPVCERSEKTRETEDAAVAVVVEVPVAASLRRTLLEDPIDDGCGTCLDL